VKANDDCGKAIHIPAFGAVVVCFTYTVQTTLFEARKRLPNKLDLSRQTVVWTTDVLDLGPHATLSGPIRDSLRLILLDEG
jgi:hypothetical protein